MNISKHLILSIIPFTFFIAKSIGQNVGINTTGVAADASSILDISSTDKGILIPRVDIIDLNTAAPITTPVNSLLVYNTNITSGEGFYFWNGTKWINITDNSGNADEDWYEVGTLNDPDNINDNIFTLGNVSIGTNSSNNSLTIVNGGINIDSDGNNDWASVYNYNDGLVLSASIQSLNDRHFFIHPNGNVGIGTVTPSNDLHVSGGTGSGVIKIEADTDNTTESDQAYILLEQDGGTVKAHLGFGSTEATGDVFRIGLRGGINPNIDYNTFTINAQNKRVGFNTSNANRPLSVFGTGTPANMTGGGPWATFSDSTLKKNIHPYTEGLSLITQVSPKSFSYNRKYETIFGGGKSLNNHIYQGIIAQELQKIAPDMVEKITVVVEENNKKIEKQFLQVSTNKFTYALINATKEQQVIIENQTLKIKELEARLEEIEKSINK